MSFARVLAVIASVVIVAAAIAGLTFLAVVFQGWLEAGFVAIGLMLMIVIAWAFVVSPSSA